MCRVSIEMIGSVGDACQQDIAAREGDRGGEEEAMSRPQTSKLG